MTDFNSVMNMPLASAEPPEALPNGHYLLQVMPNPKKVTAQTGNEGLEYVLRPIRAISVEDEQALQDRGGIKDKDKVRQRFWMTEDAAYRFGEFVVACGVELEPDKKTEQYISEVVGKQVVGFLRKEMNKDGKGSRNEVTEFASPDAE